MFRSRGKSPMASTKFVTLFTVLVMLAPTIAMATEFIVGDDSGWKTNFDYQAWAKGKDFQVGDTLVFNYKAPNHNVFKVNGTGFKECIKPTANDQAPVTTGNDKIELKSSGKKWYICSVKNHCADLKMKLFINVAEKSSSVRGIGLSGFQVFIPAFVVAISAIIASFA